MCSFLWALEQNLWDYELVTKCKFILVTQKQLKNLFSYLDWCNGWLLNRRVLWSIALTAVDWSPFGFASLFLLNIKCNFDLWTQVTIALMLLNCREYPHCFTVLECLFLNLGFRKPGEAGIIMGKLKACPFIKSLNFLVLGNQERWDS